MATGVHRMGRTSLGDAGAWAVPQLDRALAAPMHHGRRLRCRTQGARLAPQQRSERRPPDGEAEEVSPEHRRRESAREPARAAGRSAPTLCGEIARNGGRDAVVPRPPPRPPMRIGTDRAGEARRRPALRALTEARNVPKRSTACRPEAASAPAAVHPGRLPPPQPLRANPGTAPLPAPAQHQRPPPRRTRRTTQGTPPHPRREEHPLGRNPVEAAACPNPANQEGHRARTFRLPGLRPVGTRVRRGPVDGCRCPAGDRVWRRCCGRVCRRPVRRRRVGA